MPRFRFEIRRAVPPEDAGRPRATILAVFGVSVVFFLLAKFLPLGSALQRDMITAATTMESALEAVRDCRAAAGLPFDEEADPNRTGLVGLEISPLTTSRGDLEAKRTTTNPTLAALVVFLLTEADVERGDTIAIGASGSFPGLIVAVLSAARAMGVRPLAIYSLGASEWGANEPDFDWLRIEECLREEDILRFEPVAVSLGGARDIAEDISLETRSALETEVRTSGVFLVREPELRRNVELRMQIYKAAAGTVGIKAFVNVGGAWANIGEASEILHLPPGLVRSPQLPPPEKRGVLYEMASRGIPVIHLLHVRGLVERYGLPWDPVPLPRPGKGRIYGLARERQPAFLGLAGAYFLTVLVVLLLGPLRPAL